MNDDSPDSPYISSASAGKLLGVSPRTIRNWVTAGKLSAISGKRGILLRRADVVEFGKLSGHFPEDGEAGNASGNASATSSGNASATSSGNASPLSDIVDVAPPTERQLEVVRDTLLRPLIEQNERQQATITAQAETVGRLTAERDALQARLSALEAANDVKLVSMSSASPGLSQRPQKRRRSTWWLRMFEHDE